MELFAVIVGMSQLELTDSVEVDFFDKVSNVRYQRGGVLVPRGASEVEIKQRVAKRVAELEAEASTPAPSQRKDKPVPMPTGLINKAIYTDARDERIDPDTLER